MAMDELKYIIADDNASSRTLLRRFMELAPNVSLAGEAEDGEQLVQLVICEEPHLALVDIGMPRLNGLEAIKECMKHVPQLKVIFITGTDQFALEAFNLYAIDYILKPLDRFRLLHAVERARSVIKARSDESQEQLRFLKETLHKLIVRSEKTIHFLPMKDIIFIEKSGRKTKIHTYQKTIETAETLGMLLKKLDYSFIQSHRAYLINFRHISSITPSGETNVVYFDQYPYPAYISKSKLTQVLDWFEVMNQG